MREYYEFKNFVEEHLAVFLPETYRDATIETMVIRKSNGMNYNGLTIRLGKNGAAPILRMEPYFQRVCEGVSIDTVLQEIARDYVEMAENAAETLQLNACFDNICNSSWQEVKEHLGFQIMNRQKNEELLQGKAFTEVLDLAKTYILFWKRDDVLYKAIISQALMQQWQVSIEQLDEAASKNMQKVFPKRYEPLAPWPLVVIGYPALTVVTTERCNFASAILYDGVLEELRDMLHEDFYLVPASTEEFLVCPKGRMDPNSLRMILREINLEVVGEQLFLSDNLYEYTEKSGKIQIV